MPDRHPTPDTREWLLRKLFNQKSECYTCEEDTSNLDKLVESGAIHISRDTNLTLSRPPPSPLRYATKDLCVGLPL